MTSAIQTAREQISTARQEGIIPGYVAAEADRLLDDIEKEGYSTPELVEPAPEEAVNTNGGVDYRRSLALDIAKGARPYPNVEGLISAAKVIEAYLKGE